MSLFILICIFVIIFLGVGFIVMLLWNWLMPILFALPTITFIQTLGLLLLLKFLFKVNFKIEYEKFFRTFKNNFNS